MPPLVLCAVAADCDAAHVVATGRQMEADGAFTVRFVHVVPYTLRAMQAVASAAVAGGLVDACLDATIEDQAPPFMAALGVADDSVDVLTGDAVQQLLRYADRMGAAMIVTGSRRRRRVSSALGESVPWALVAHGSAPVLVTSSLSQLGDDGPVLCGVPPSRSRAPRIVRAAAGLARRLERPLVLAAAVDAVDEPTLAGAWSLAARAPIKEPSAAATALLDHASTWQDVPRGVRIAVRAGIPSSSLADLAEQEGAAVLVVGYRPAGVVGTLLGASISQELIRMTSRAVLVVPPDGRR